MENENKTLYIWDLANTLFPQTWNESLIGSSSYKDWIQKKSGKPLSEISPREYEEGFRYFYENGELVLLNVQRDFREVLDWTKNNEAFTTGVPEQLDWRAEYLLPKIGYDVRTYLKRVNSTFDYGETNTKTEEMIKDYIDRKTSEGYNTFIYTDDDLSNCQTFSKVLRSNNQDPDKITFRIYNILNDQSGVQNKGDYFTIGGLVDLLENEKKLWKDEL